MGFNSFAAAASLLLLAACGGAEFSAAGGESGGQGGSGQGQSGTSVATGGDSQGTSGSAGAMTTGASGAGGSTAGASVTSGSGGQVLVDAGRDASTGSGGRPVVDASAVDMGPPDTGAPATCPVTEPGGGGACSGAISCTYGTHPRLACRRQYTCTGGHWAVAPSAMCTDLAACVSEQPLPVIGKICSAAGHDCMWDTGLYCRCLACPDATSCPNWNCFPPPNNCGITPPNLGQKCDANSMPAVCDFGNCALGTRVTVTCVNGIVHWTFPNCQ